MSHCPDKISFDIHPGLSSPVRSFLLKGPRQYFFCGLFLLFVFRICHVFLSVRCSLVVTCLERAGLLTLLYVMFYCDFVTIPCGVLGQVVLDCINF